jgi:hypothetical protein
MKNKYEIRGDKVAIFLNRRDGLKLETFISLPDLEKVKSFDGKWYATTKKGLNGFYVNGIFQDSLKTIYLHRLVLEAPKGYHVDHINHDTLDNTRNNLRIVSHAQNHQNRTHLHKRNTSGVRGVMWSTHAGKWKASVRVAGVSKFERFFDNKEDAVEAVERARKVYMPFSEEALNYTQEYTEKDLLKDYIPYQHHKKTSNRKSKSGYLGVYWHKSSQRWTSYNISNGQKRYLGSFKNKEDAIEAVIKANESKEAY